MTISSVKRWLSQLQLLLRDNADVRYQDWKLAYGVQLQSSSHSDRYLPTQRKTYDHLY